MEKEECENYQNFAKEVKRILRSLGKTNFINPVELEGLIVKYKIKS